LTIGLVYHLQNILHLEPLPTCWLLASCILSKISSTWSLCPPVDCWPNVSSQEYPPPEACAHLLTVGLMYPLQNILHLEPVSSFPILLPAKTKKNNALRKKKLWRIQ
jgi:hypothetical protein